MKFSRFLITVVFVAVAGWVGFIIGSLPQANEALSNLAKFEPLVAQSATDGPANVERDDSGIASANILPDPRLAITPPTELLVGESPTTETTRAQLPGSGFPEVDASAGQVDPGEDSRRAEPIVQPLPLPPEFDWIEGVPYMRQNRELIQREPIDIEWAAETEAQLKNFIYEHTEIAQEYGNPTVHCRTTQCEVTFIRNGSVEWDSLTSQEFRALVEPFFELSEGSQWSLSWGETRPTQYSMDAHYEDGVSTLYWHLGK